MRKLITTNPLKIFAAFFVAMSFFSLAGANPCDSDVEKYCGNLTPGFGNIGSCLESNLANLSISCGEFMKKMDNVIKRVKSACSDPARQYCWDVSPGYGRVKNCLMSKMDKLPQECQDALQGKGK